MTRATRTLSVVGASLILGGIGVAVADSADGSGRPLRGSLAPLDSSRIAGWTELARLTPEALGDGRIRAIDFVGDSLFVLQANAWSLIVDGQVLGTYGTAVTGAPGYLARAEGIVRTASAVAVLDAPRHRITMWSTAGERIADRVLGQSAGQVALHQSLTPSATGMLLTSWVSTDSGGHWLVQRLRDGGADTLPPSAGQRTRESFNVPHLLPRSDSSLVVVSADTWQIQQFSESFSRLTLAQRQDAPHYAVPAALARRLRERIAMMPEAQRRDFLLAEALPSVRSATMTADGHILVLTVRDDESTVAELVQLDGHAIAALWVQPDSSTLFASRGSLLRVREEDAFTIIERLRLRAHD